MNKKKLLSLALVVIMIATLSFSTLAWFSDSDSVTNTTLEIRNNLTQHNLIREDYNANSYANMLVTEVFGNDKYSSLAGSVCVL
jgi:predicted ribosomally synthesized peptide with SipW-like signal peptide